MWYKKYLKVKLVFRIIVEVLLLIKCMLCLKLEWFLNDLDYWEKKNLCEILDLLIKKIYEYWDVYFDI